MDQSPLYDDTVPIACTAGSAELSVRMEQIERLRASVTRVSRTADGIVLAFPDEPDVRAELASFTIEEKACCAFWGFAITTEGDEVVLRWDGPSAVAGVFGELVAFFEGDRPLTALEGLL